MIVVAIHSNGELVIDGITNWELKNKCFWLYEEGILRAIVPSDSLISFEDEEKGDRRTDE